MSIVSFGPREKRKAEAEILFPDFPEYLFADITSKNIDEHHKDFPDRTSENLVFSLVSHMQEFPTAHPHRAWLTPPTRPGQMAFENDCSSPYTWPSSSKDYCENKLKLVFDGKEHLYLVYKYDKKGDREIIAFMFWGGEFSPKPPGYTYKPAELARFRDTQCKQADSEIVISSTTLTHPNVTHSLVVDIDLLGAPPRVDGPKNIGSILINKMESLLERSSAKTVKVHLFSLAWRIAESEADCRTEGKYFGLSEHIYSKLGFKYDRSDSQNMWKKLR